MSLNGYSKSTFRDKKGREIKTECDFLSKRLRHADGSYGTYRNGKLIAFEDMPAAQSKFHAPTPVSTIVAEPEKEKEKVCRVRKNFDVNAQTMKL
jgi:hypothetical protein